MRRFGLVLFIICFVSPYADAQLWKLRRYEAAAGVGPTFLFGDIGGFSRTKNILGIRDLSFMQTRFDMNVNFKYRITQDINIRLSFSSGLLHASDERGSNESRGYETSISFFEPALIGEYYFIKNKSENSYLFTKSRSKSVGDLFRSLDFYVFTGIGGLSYTGKPNDKLKTKQALEGFSTGGFTPVIPVGLGALMVFSPDFNFGVDLCGRYSFSDNIDGFTSPHSKAKDVYYFLNFTVTYKMKTGAHGLPSFR
jgi:hypothetical protein